MSWNKNTVNHSEIDSYMGFLKEFNVPYEVKVLGIIRGHGLNDTEDNGTYKMRRLEYKDKVLLEQILRTNDCDADDTIISRKFYKGEEPKDWKIEIKDTNE